MDWHTIPSFGPYDFEGFYERLVNEAPAQATLVEVGCYYGRSLVHLGVLAQRADKGLQIHGVDWGEGMGGGTSTRAALIENICRAGLTDTVRLTFEPSPDAARRFAEDSCWLVFLDAAHTHEAVAADIRAWMPKVAPDGWLAGHDFRWHTVVEPVHALLRGVMHDPAFDNCWKAPRQKVRTGPGVNIYKPTMIPQSLDPDYA